MPTTIPSPEQGVTPADPDADGQTSPLSGVFGQSVTVPAYAKINLSLDVLSRRPDGYHEVRMVMQSLTLHDTLTLRRTAEPGIRLTPRHAERHPDISWDKQNLIFRAAQRFLDTYPADGGVHITVDKRIPSAAGLAGGSSDAAATLRGMAALFQVRTDLPTLQALGVTLGADVPYCLMLGTALAEGIGERLTPLPAAPPLFAVIVKPPVDVSTKYVYEHLSLTPQTRHPDTAAMLAALAQGDPEGLCAALDNLLEPVARTLCPDIALLEEELLRLGALGARMTGSGPTVFGLFSEAGKAEEAAAFFRQNGYPETSFATNFFHPTVEFF